MTQLTCSYLSLPERCYERVAPEAFVDPQLRVFNEDLARTLGVAFHDDAHAAMVLSGQQLLPGSEPIAQAYAGHQFGHFVPQLGDGRAHLLGEASGFDIQLKGSGRTRFSRRGDGKSALGPVIREFLVSEGMHALGIPTTRSLAIVTTGEDVLRQDGPEPGGILTRVAASHIRVGTFQYFVCRQDDEALRALVDYTIERHYPEVAAVKTLPERCLALLRAFAERQGDLVASWYGLGFIHGVMNTDNCALAGITIDYGPCAFQDEFSLRKVFSSIDHQGRYAYSNQMSIIQWNVLRFAECLLPLIADKPEQASELANEVLKDVFATYGTRLHNVFARKLGLGGKHEGDESLVDGLLTYLDAHALDFTLSFYRLPDLLTGDDRHFPQDSRLSDFLAKWQARQPDAQLMAAANPHVIPRNHHVQAVIDSAYTDDYGPLHEMWSALQSPFAVDAKLKRFAEPPAEHERVRQTFCGT